MELKDIKIGDKIKYKNKKSVWTGKIIHIDSLGNIYTLYNKLKIEDIIKVL